MHQRLINSEISCGAAIPFGISKVCLTAFCLAAQNIGDSIGGASRIATWASIKVTCNKGVAKTTTVSAPGSVGGMEGPFSAVVMPVKVTTAGNKITILAQGAPPPEAVTAFNACKTRTCSFIWAQVVATGSCDAGGNPHVQIKPTASKSPHASWNVMDTSGRVWGAEKAASGFMGLWDCPGGTMSGGGDPQQSPVL